MAKATLFGVPASHPTYAAELMLRQKGVAYRRVDLVAVLHRRVLRVLGFPGITVPALRLDGTRVQGTRAIAEALDALRPGAPLVPDPAVAAAEAWADERYQPVPRRLVWHALSRDRSTLATFLVDAKLGVPVSVAAGVGAPVIRAAVRANDADEAHVRADLASLPELIDHVDDLLRRRDDRRGAAERRRLPDQRPPRPCWRRWTTSGRCSRAGRSWSTRAGSRPSYPGRVPKVFPQDWLQA